MAHTVKWTRVGGSPTDIGHSYQKGFVHPEDADGMRRYRIVLIITRSDREAFEDALLSLFATLRVRPMVIKTTNYNRKYIVPNGSQGTLTTAYQSLTGLYPEAVTTDEGDPYGGNVTVTFVKALI